MKVLARIACIIALVAIGAHTKPRKATLHNVVKASYYADKFNGRRMANGERFSQEAFTVAHPNYKLGTYVRLTNMLNNMTAIAQVTDRGPFAPGSKGTQPSHSYAIDLSWATAAALGIRRKDGYGYLKIEELKEADTNEQAKN